MICERCGSDRCMSVTDGYSYCTRGCNIADWFMDFDPAYVLNTGTGTVHFIWSTDGHDGICWSIPSFGPHYWDTDTWRIFGEMPSEGKRICGSCQVRIGMRYRQALSGETERMAEAR